ncbi:hypothetical protein N2152v2_002235 [Parachlorella kessleri]
MASVLGSADDLQAAIQEFNSQSPAAWRKERPGLHVEAATSQPPAEASSSDDDDSPAERRKLELDRKDAQLVGVLEELGERRAVCRMLQHEYGRMRDRAVRLRRQRNVLVEERNNLVMEAAAAQDDLERAIDQLTAQAAGVNNLRSQVAALQQALMQERGVVEKLRWELHGVKAARDWLHPQLEALTAENAFLRQQQQQQPQQEPLQRPTADAAGAAGAAAGACLPSVLEGPDQAPTMHLGASLGSCAAATCQAERFPPCLPLELLSLGLGLLQRQRHSSPPAAVQRRNSGWDSDEDHAGGTAGGASQDQLVGDAQLAGSSQAEGRGVLGIQLLLRAQHSAGRGAKREAAWLEEQQGSLSHAPGAVEEEALQSQRKRICQREQQEQEGQRE